MSTLYHARYFAYELTLSLFDACVDLNPHQIEAALFDTYKLLQTSTKKQSGLNARKAALRNVP
ncbi:hypothetical protein [Desulfobacterium sp. N47]|uniref:Uncharacterized protein n=1 Tax=uncultured Desulfobacterium sp. TaxID=201089 RepID=E1YMU0_9BACT|nr:unknown protein [uncultured Desulfobacterium sp.]